MANGKVKKTNKREFGKAYIRALKKSALFKDNIKLNNRTQVWMSHGDEVVKVPTGFEIIARSDNIFLSMIMLFFNSPLISLE